MSDASLNSVRARLARRVHAVKTAHASIFHSTFQRFWRSLHSDPMLAGILVTLARGTHGADHATQVINTGHPIVEVDEHEHVLLCYDILDHCSASDDSDIELRLGYIYSSPSDKERYLLTFKSTILTPLCNHLEWALDDRHVTLGLLLRYKQKCEWFQRESLYALWKGDSRRGEKHLAFRLYEYLHDYGVPFVIEPWSASGRTDIIASRGTSAAMLADTKVFNPRAQGIQYIAKGVAQAYRYTLDYNMPCGCLVVFVCSEPILQCALSSVIASVPYLYYNNKTLFVLVIDIFPGRETASRTLPITTAQLTERSAIAAIAAQNRKGAAE